MISEKLACAIERQLSEFFSEQIRISTFLPVGGGCINLTLKAETSVGPFFVKLNSGETGWHNFQCEKRGLLLLKQKSAFRVPSVISTFEEGEWAILILEYINSGIKASSFWEEFGSQLANLHRVSSGNFGLDHDNFIGSLSQSNQARLTWPEFFIEERIIPQLKLARQSGNLLQNDADAFNKLFKALPSIFPEEKPSLLHGDLWNGNFMVAEDGVAVLIDPAVYYGHREMDLAFSKLFGGFAREFYEAYNQEWPLEPGFSERESICNLYPLLVHVNLFGGGYVNSIRQIINRFN